MKSIVTNLTLFKISWLACVIGAAAGMPWIGVLAILAASIVHIASAEIKSRTVALLASAALIGLVWESFMIVGGWLEYVDHTGPIAPYWIIAMWVLFATTLNVGFRWLKDHLLVAALVGGIGGPMAFAAGAKAGAVQFENPTTALVIVGIGWALMMPLMVYISRYLNGHPNLEAAVSNAPESSERTVAIDHAA
ncbi:MAG: DUF2878 domain-containing protein [Pseudomonadota bacterium]